MSADDRSLRQAALDVGVNVFAVDLLAESVLRAPWCESLHARGEPLLLPWPVRRSDCPGWVGVEVIVRPLKEGDKITPAVKVDNTWAADAEYASWFPIAPRPLAPEDTEVWLVVKEHALVCPEAALTVADRDRLQLVYVLPAAWELYGHPFGSFDECRAFMQASELPLGWVAKQVRLGYGQRAVKRLPGPVTTAPADAGYTMGDWFRDLGKAP